MGRNDPLIMINAFFAALPIIPVWSKNSSRLVGSKTRKFFNADKFIKGTRDPLRCDRFVIEDFARDRIHRIYRFNRIKKTLAFSSETGKPEGNQALRIAVRFRLFISGPRFDPWTAHQYNQRLRSSTLETHFPIKPV
jgi:hypothetical protein